MFDWRATASEIEAWLRVQFKGGGVQLQYLFDRDVVLFEIKDPGLTGGHAELEISEEALEDHAPETIIADLDAQNVPKRLRLDPTMRLQYYRRRDVPYFETRWVTCDEVRYRVVRDADHNVGVYDQADKPLPGLQKSMVVLPKSIYGRQADQWCEDIRKWRVGPPVMSAGFNRERPHNDLPPLPPAVELETREVLRAAIRANRVLGELKGLGDVLPDQAILVNGIVLQEAKASSEIENIVTSNDAIYRAIGREDSASADPHAKEVLRYREALWQGFEAIKKRPISANLLIDIAGIIRRTDAGIRKTPGTRVTGIGGRVVYTPPEGERLIRDLLGNLETFLYADDGLDPLIKVAIAHYQFEAIHPFTDGNGRTGRILNILYLVDQGLLEVPVLYLSHYIIRTKSEYYEGLRRVTEASAWVEWVLYMLRAIEETAQETKERIVGIRQLMDETSEEAKKKAAGVYSRELIGLVFANPYSKIGFVVDAGIAKRQTASKYLKALESAGILRGVKVGREVYYVNERLVEVLAK